MFFFGIAYGRLYRSGCFGTPYYLGGNKLAEKIFMCLLREVSSFFERLSLFLLNFNDDINIFYNPCIDEISHELFGHWQNAFGEDKKFYWELFAECYSYADKHLGSLISKLRETDVISISSDHGICAVDTVFHLNTYLYERNMLSVENDQINLKNTMLFYHPCNSGAMFTQVSRKKNSEIIQELKKLKINNRRVIKDVIDFKKRTVFGDYYIIPEKGIYLDSTLGTAVFESTNKTGCHIVNTGDDFLKAIFFVNKNIQIDKTKNIYISKILKDIMRGKL